MSVLKESESHSSPPPPPLPSYSLVQNFRVDIKALNTCEASRVDENELDLAIKRLFLLDEYFNKVFHLSNCYLRPQLQDGPKCGLVALSIATSGGKNFVSVDEIFQAAVSLGLTKQGEMFSANSLALLAEKCCGFKTRVIAGGLSSHFNCIVDNLLRKCLLLAPYDADCNHSPCCKKGSKAHWALITGFLIIERNTDVKNIENDDCVILNTVKGISPCNCTEDSNNFNLPLSVSAYEEKIIIGKNPLKMPKENNGLKEGKFYLIGMQGKSLHVGLWPFEEMDESNDNLVFFSASRDSDCYVLPKGGLEEGLKGKAIILEYV